MGQFPQPSSRPIPGKLPWSQPPGGMCGSTSLFCHIIFLFSKIVYDKRSNCLHCLTEASCELRPFHVTYYYYYYRINLLLTILRVVIVSFRQNSDFLLLLLQNKVTITFYSDPVSVCL